MKSTKPIHEQIYKENIRTETSNTNFRSDSFHTQYCPRSIIRTCCLKSVYKTSPYTNTKQNIHSHFIYQYHIKEKEWTETIKKLTPPPNKQTNKHTNNNYTHAHTISLSVCLSVCLSLSTQNSHNKNKTQFNNYNLKKRRLRQTKNKQ